MWLLSNSEAVLFIAIVVAMVALAVMVVGCGQDSA
jgi:cell division protein FtsL